VAESWVIGSALLLAVLALVTGAAGAFLSAARLVLPLVALSPFDPW